jgi:proteasome lid subunit RPN8/RPN11
MMTEADQMIAAALAAMNAKMATDGLPTFHDHNMVIVDAALRLSSEACEVVLCYMLDRSRRLLGVEEMARGSETQAVFSRTHLARRAAAVGASYCFLIHNHPSANPEPSDDDRAAAERIDMQMSAIDVMVLGYYSVTHGGFGDARTGKVTLFADLAKLKIQSPTIRRECPHCHGPLEEPATTRKPRRRTGSPRQGPVRLIAASPPPS